MIRRSRLESLLHDYVQGDLRDAERREVERRIATDPKARALHEEVVAAQGALRMLRERPEPPVAARDVLPGIQAAIAATAFEPRPRLALEGLGTRYYRRLAVAATLLFAVTVGYLSFSAGPGDLPAPNPAPAFSGAIELGTRREGISAAELFRIYDMSIDPDDPVEPFANVIEIAGSR